MDVLIDLTDPETNLTYLFYVSEKDYQRCTEDENYANSLLRHAKINYRNSTVNESATETTETECDGSNGTSQSQPIGKGSSTQEKKVWTKKETQLIINCVEAHYDELNHPKKRKYIWNNVSNDMISHGVIVTSTSCAQKWKNLLRSYKSCKDNLSKSRFLFFDEMNEFLGNKANISSPHTMDTEINDSETENVDPVREVQDIEEVTEVRESSKKTEMTKRRNPRTLYFQEKTRFLEIKTKDIERRKKEESSYMKIRIRRKKNKFNCVEKNMREQVNNYFYYFRLIFTIKKVIFFFIYFI